MELDGAQRELLVQIFGILGNIISIAVYVAPCPTFRQIYRKKSTLGYHSLPYVVALFSSMLWFYYALIKGKSILLITINSVGCIIETIYIIIYIVYANREARENVIKAIVSLDVCGFGLILILTIFKFHGHLRVEIVAWICMVVAALVFAAPLGILFKVIKTRSVEYMPFALSVALTLSAVMWFFYGYFKGDPFVALPNVAGFILGLVQMVLYLIFRKDPKTMLDDEKIPEHIINMVILGGPEVHPVDSKINEIKNKNNEDEEEKEEQTKIMGPLSGEPARATINLGPSPLVLCAA